MSVQSPEELQANLDEYRGQLEQACGFSLCLVSFYRQTTCAYVQVDELLTLDPGNAEYQDLHTSLLEVRCLHRCYFSASLQLFCVRRSTHWHTALQVIQLTDDLLRDAQQQQEPAVPVPRPRCKPLHQECVSLPKHVLASSILNICMFWPAAWALLCFGQCILPTCQLQIF